EAPTPDLSVSIAPTRTAAALVPGGTASVLLRVGDASGAGGSRGTHLRIALPSGVQLASPVSTDRGGSCGSGAPIDCPLGSLSPGDSSQASLALKLLGPGSYAISAWVTQEGADANPADNQTLITLDVAEPANLWAGVASTARAAVGA